MKKQIVILSIFASVVAGAVTLTHIVDGTATITTATIGTATFTNTPTVMGVPLVTNTSSGGNWTSSGTANSTLSGTASANSLVVTNSATVGAIYGPNLGGFPFYGHSDGTNDAISVTTDNSYAPANHVYGMFVHHSVNDPNTGTIAAGTGATVSELIIPTSNSNAYTDRMTGSFGYLHHEGSGALATAIGSYNVVGIYGSGSINEAQGVVADLGLSAGTTGNILYAYGFFCRTMSRLGSGTLGTAYGLYLKPQTAATNNWGFYIEGTNNSYSGGHILLGTTADSGNGWIQLPASTLNTGGIAFGPLTSETIYRSGIGILKVGGAFASTGKITSGDNVEPATTASFDLGTSSVKWRNIWNSGTLNVGGAISGSGTASFSAIVGTSTSTTRSAGQVGERMSSVIASGSAVSLTTATTTNVTSITLTPGNWIVYGKVNFSDSGTTGTDYKFGQSTTSATLGADPTYGEIPLVTTALSGTLKQNIPQQDYSVATATTTVVYLVAQATFSAGTAAAFGEIYARRTD
jgi:hypothetical protein